MNGNILENRCVEMNGSETNTECTGRLTYLFFENKISFDKGEVKTYGICAFCTDNTGKPEGCIICDVSCSISHAKKIFDRIEREEIHPGDIPSFVEAMLDEISEESPSL